MFLVESIAGSNRVAWNVFLGFTQECSEPFSRTLKSTEIRGYLDRSFQESKKQDKGGGDEEKGPESALNKL